jgi:hypothetical protein
MSYILSNLLYKRLKAENIKCNNIILYIIFLGGFGKKIAIDLGMAIQGL